MIPREMCSSYISQQRISKINHIIYESKDRSTVDHSAPVFFCCLFLIYNYIIFPELTYLYIGAIVQIEQGRGRKIKRLKEDRDQKSGTGSEVRWWLPEDGKGKRYRKTPTYV